MSKYYLLSQTYASIINTPHKIERIKIFLQAGKSYDWISQELAVSKQTISDIKKSMPPPTIQLPSEKTRVCA